MSRIQTITETRTKGPSGLWEAFVNWLRSLLPANYQQYWWLLLIAIIVMALLLLKWLLG